MIDENLDELKIALDPTHPDHILPLALPPSAKVLDVGCGAGQSLIASYPDRVTFGIDLDFRSLETGKALSDRIRFANAKAEALPFKSAVFDFVFARVSLPYTNVAASLREIRRVLKEDGRIWLALHTFGLTWRQAKPTNYKGKIWFACIVANSLLFHFLGRQFRFLGRYESFQTEAGMRRALSRSGFEDIHVERGERTFVATARAAGGVGR